MAIRKFAVVALLLQLNTASAAFASFGFIQHTDGKLFIETTAPLNRIDFVHYQFLSTDGNLYCCRRANRKELIPVRRSDDQQADPGARYRYEISKTSPSFQNRFYIGTALINIERPIQFDEDTITGKTQNRSFYTTHRCIESEGINLTAASNGKIEAMYYSLGYEVDLTAVKASSVCAGTNRTSR